MLIPTANGTLKNFYFNLKHFTQVVPFIFIYLNTSIKVPVKFCVLFKAALIIKKKS